MKTVHTSELQESLRRLGVKKGDTLLMHSALHSLGHVEEGPEAVLDALREAVGTEGTLVLPTLVQRDFVHAYANWNRETSPSDVGLLTEIFRRQEGVLRSDQATHSVAAWGKRAAELTAEHGQRGLRLGAFGDTPFSEDSPWEKLEAWNAKVLFLGVTFRNNTLHHLSEYRLVNELLRALPSHRQEELLSRLRYRHGDDIHDGIWPYIAENERLQIEMLAMGTAEQTMCGDAALCVVEVPTMMHYMEDQMLHRPKRVFVPEAMDWLRSAGF